MVSVQLLKFNPIAFRIALASSWLASSYIMQADAIAIVNNFDKENV